MVSIGCATADGEASEEWLPIPGYAGVYQASTAGRIRSIDRTERHMGGVRSRKGRVLRPALNRKTGRLYVCLYSGRRPGTKRNVHVLVAQAFLGERPDGYECCHTNGDALDNRVANLRWDTASENQIDIVRHGRHREANKTACVNGHPFDVTNTILRVRKGGRTWRQCRACRDASNRARRRSR